MKPSSVVWKRRSKAMSELWNRIKADKQFNNECAAAERKAQKAADRAREKLRVAEEKEVERHQKVMAEISRKNRAIYSEVYSSVYDPLEEAAYSRAEQRLK